MVCSEDQPGGSGDDPVEGRDLRHEVIQKEEKEAIRLARQRELAEQRRMEQKLWDEEEEVRRVRRQRAADRRREERLRQELEAANLPLHIWDLLIFPCP